MIERATGRRIGNADLRIPVRSPPFTVERAKPVRPGFLLGTFGTGLPYSREEGTKAMRDDIKRLHRVPADGKIAGVCAGLGEYFRLDPVFFRLAWTAVTLMTGVVPGIVAYLIAWILVPREPISHAAEQVEHPSGSRA